MKVIANIGNDRVLVEINKTEVASLHGIENTYSSDFNKNWMEVGYEFDLAKISTTMRDVRYLDKSRLGTIINQLENTVATVKSIQVNAQALTLFETLSKDNI